MKHTRRTKTSTLGGLVRTERTEVYDNEANQVTVTRRIKVAAVPVWKWTHERPAKLSDMWGRI